MKNNNIFESKIALMIYLVAVIGLYLNFNAYKKINLSRFIFSVLSAITTIPIFKHFYPNIYYWKLSEFDNPQNYDNIDLNLISTWILIAIFIFALTHFFLPIVIDSFLMKKIYPLVKDSIRKMSLKNRLHFYKNLLKGISISSKGGQFLWENSLDEKKLLESELRLSIFIISKSISFSLVLIYCCYLYGFNYRFTLIILIAFILKIILDLASLFSIAIIEDNYKNENILN